jgi:hypothetical protein
MSIFVSYARADYETAKELASFLLMRGYDVWWDVRLVGSDEFRDAIQEELAKAAAVIVIWSPNSAVSRFVRQEADEGLHHRKLIATRVRGFDIRQMPLGFREQHTDYADEREKIVAALTKMGALPLRRPSAPAPKEGPTVEPNSESFAGSAATVGDRAAVRHEAPPIMETQGAWGRPVSRRIGEVVTALALLACAVFFAWQASLLPFGEVGLPGPGFFPFALGMALGVLALVLLFHALRTVDALGQIFLGHRDVLVAIGGLICVAVAFERADTYLILGTFTVAMLVIVGRTAVWRAVLGASLGMVAVWAVFNRALGVRLPVGEFWAHSAGSAAAAFASALF